jgi:hypothetical protein
VGTGARRQALTATPASAPPTAEEARLAAARAGTEPWRRWGPYLSERQWGTVREDYSAGGTAWEYLPHDHARSRAYRWGEDGIAGISDDRQRLCFALALWNGVDPILKERMFGLTGNEGNHGEDVKEYYFHLDNVPSHAYMKYLYKYPQRAYPYADLVAVNRARSHKEPEYELLDTGIFDDDRYFDVFVEYAKAGPDDLLMRPRRRAAAPSSHALVPQRMGLGGRARQAFDRHRGAECRHDPSPGDASDPPHLLAARRARRRRDLHRERDEHAAPVRRAEPVAVREGRVPRVRRGRPPGRRESRAPRHQGGPALRASRAGVWGDRDPPAPHRARPSARSLRRRVRRRVRAPARGGRRVL